MIASSGPAARAAKGAIVGLLLASTAGCFLKKYVGHPVPVANAIGDSTTVLAGTKLHVYASQRYEVYGPTDVSVSMAVPQLDRAYSEFEKYFGRQGPRMAVVLADSAFALTPADAGMFATRGLHAFVYVRPHNLRYIEGVPPDLTEDEIWPVAPRAASELVVAYAEARRHQPPSVEIAAHPSERHRTVFPLWFDDAVVALLSDPGAPDRIMSYLRNQIAEAPPIDELLSLHGAPSVDTVTAREGRTISGAAGVGFTLLAIAREGPRIVGRFADAFFAGRDGWSTVRASPHLPHDAREMQRVWREWVMDEYGR